VKGPAQPSLHFFELLALFGVEICPVVAEESSMEIASRSFTESCQQRCILWPLYRDWQLGAAGLGFVAEYRRNDWGHGN